MNNTMTSEHIFTYTDIFQNKNSILEERVEEILNAWKFEGTYLEKFNYLKLLW
jgi:hypothetical protein